MTPEMMVQLVMEDEFDPDEVERLAQGDWAEFEAKASDGGTLLIIPQRIDRFEQTLLGYFSFQHVSKHYDVYHRSETPLGRVLKHAGTIHQYASWPSSHWSLNLNPTYYNGSRENRHISAPDIEQAAVRMWNVVLNSRITKPD